MQFITTLLIASLVAMTVAAPVSKTEAETAVVNTRFLTYDLEERDAAAEPDTKKAVVNSRFLTYED